MTDFPADLRYTKDHEWARKEGDHLVVGITAHAVEQLGEITMVTLPEPGASLRAGESFGDVDSVKAVSELYAPVAGEVVAINEALEDNPETLNANPYSEGWLIKLKPTDPLAFDTLMDVAAYQALTSG